MIEYLRDLNIVTIMIRFVTAIICGGAIGIERGAKKQAAGFRTHILVCVGATIVMMTGQFAVDYLNYTADPTRMGAQVISGIGFLGVGTIIITQTNKVKGLTTAAGLWTAACIGLAIGIGFYEAAIVGTLLVVFVVVALQKIDELFYTKAAQSDFFVELERISNIKSLLYHLKENNLSVRSFEVKKSGYGDSGFVSVLLTVKKNNRKDNTNMFDVIGECEGLVFIEEIL